MSLLSFKKEKHNRKGMHTSPNMSFRPPSISQMLMSRSRSPQSHNPVVFESNFIHQVNKLLTSNKDLCSSGLGSDVKDTRISSASSGWNLSRVQNETNKSNVKVDFVSKAADYKDFKRIRQGFKEFSNKDKNESLQNLITDSQNNRSVSKNSNLLTKHTTSPRVSLSKTRLSINSNSRTGEPISSTIISKLNQKLNNISYQVAFCNIRKNALLIS